MKTAIAPATSPMVLPINSLRRASSIASAMAILPFGQGMSDPDSGASLDLGPDKLNLARQGARRDAAEMQAARQVSGKLQRSFILPPRPSGVRRPTMLASTEAASGPRHHSVIGQKDTPSCAPSRRSPWPHAQ